VVIRGRNFEIRPIDESEREAVLEVYHQCADFLALNPQPQPSLEMVERDMQFSRDQGGTFSGIYSPDGKLLGVLNFVQGFDGKPEQALLELLMIAAPARGHGLGSEVVKALESALSSDNQVTAFLGGVQANNPGALRFWQRLGFRIMGGPDAMTDQTTVYLMRKDLIPEHA
jgi:ribosomal protein S18 acetylase RimI-like enzyme